MDELNYPNYSKEEWDSIKKHSIKYLQIALLYFVIPFGIVLIINEVLALLKMLSWHNAGIEFWKDKATLSKLLLIILIPLLYLYWFFHLAIKNTMLQLHKDFFQYQNIEIAEIIAGQMIDLKKQTNINQSSIEMIDTYINRKLAKLPWLLEMIARKIVNKVPYLATINSYNIDDIDNNNKEKLTKDISFHMNELQLDMIQSFVPIWFFLIIPINIVFLFILLKA